jgi:ABC-type phosphate transport system substrate-binding protein
MFAKSAKLVALLGVAAVALTACTPPMPPEVKAALLEQSYTCVNGSSNVASDAIFADATTALHDSISTNCTNMSFTPVAAGQPADLVISASKPAASDCKVTTTAPYLLDAGVIVASLANASGVVLSPATAAKIFDGTITSWSDPAITADNAGVAIADEPIKVLPTTDAKALAAFGAWYKQLTGKPFTAKLLTDVKAHESVADLGTLDEGSVSLEPYSVFTAYSVNAMTIPYAASIVSDKALPAGVAPDSTGIQSAGTQLVASNNAAGVSVRLDYNAKPLPAAGSDTPAPAYDAIYPVNIMLCGSPTLTTRAVARYLLRADSLGNYTTAVGLPDTLRAVSLDAVSKGLPDPKMPSSAN